ncbi:hypothetical protein [Acinetobacter ursingii]|uniref:hypothetical protein n=1 Tax=Acinetobacter ursingii TaxID=108980 RepID=UPI003008DB6D
MREFTSDDALRLIEEMQTCYGKKYSDQWIGVDDVRIATQMVKMFQGLTAQDFKRGLQRMYQSAFCPTLPEFKQWCLQGSTWLTEHEAWAQAIAYDKSNKTISVSIFVRDALKEFQQSFSEINPKSDSQAKTFKDMYVRIIGEAKRHGLQQKFTEEIKTLETSTSDDDNRQCVPCPPELMEQLKGINRNTKVGRA